MSKARVAVLKVITKELTITAAAEQYGYSRRHLHRLLARYRTGGLDAVEPQPRRPQPSPHLTPAKTYWRNNDKTRADGPGPNSDLRRDSCETYVATHHKCGAEGIRTPDPLHAMQVRYQLRHSPIASAWQRRGILANTRSIGEIGCLRGGLR